MEVGEGKEGFIEGGKRGTLERSGAKAEFKRRSISVLRNWSWSWSTPS